MLEHKSSTNISLASIDATKKAPVEEVEALHRRCGVYTKPEVIGRILDAVGWQGKVELSRSRLLEPAAGALEFFGDDLSRVVYEIGRAHFGEIERGPISRHAGVV